MKTVNSQTSLVGNVLLNIGGRILVVILALVTTPVLVHRLNSAGYGVYILAVTAGGLIGLLDFGLGPALVTLLSRSSHSMDHPRSQKLIGTAMTLYLGIGILGLVAFVAIVPWAVRSLLHVPAGLAGEARQSLWLSAIGFGLTTSLSVFNAVPTALERYDVLTRRLVIVSLVTAAATIAYALRGGSLPGFVLINVVGAVAVVVSFYPVSRALLPQVSFRPSFDRACFGELARFSAFKFIGSLGGTLVFRFDQIAIGSLLGVSAVGYYAIPANGVLRVQSFLLQLVGPLFPRVSKLRGDHRALRALYLRSSRGMAIVSVLILLTLFVFAEPILRFWIGGNQGVIVARTSSQTMRLLVAAFLIQSLAAVPAIFCEALGKPHINNGFASLSAVIHVPLVLFFVPRLGIAGAALALLVNSLAQTVLFIIIVSNRLAKVRIAELSGNIVVPAFAAGAIAGLVGFVLLPTVTSSRMLVIGLIAVPLTYALAVVLFGGREVTGAVATGATVGYARLRMLPLWPRQGMS